MKGSSLVKKPREAFIMPRSIQRAPMLPKLASAVFLVLLVALSVQSTSVAAKRHTVKHTRFPSPSSLEVEQMSTPGMLADADEALLMRPASRVPQERKKGKCPRSDRFLLAQITNYTTSTKCATDSPKTTQVVQQEECINAPPFPRNGDSSKLKCACYDTCIIMIIFRGPGCNFSQPHQASMLPCNTCEPIPFAFPEAEGQYAQCTFSPSPNRDGSQNLTNVDILSFPGDTVCATAKNSSHHLPLGPPQGCQPVVDRRTGYEYSIGYFDYGSCNKVRNTLFFNSESCQVVDGKPPIQFDSTTDVCNPTETYSYVYECVDGIP